MWPPSRMCGRQRRVIRISPATFVSSTVCSSSSVESVERVAPESEAGVVDEDVDPAAELLDRLPARSRGAARDVGDVEREREVRLDPARDAARRPRRARPPRGAPRTIAAPIPLDAPVTTAVFPSSPTARA